MLTHNVLFELDFVILEGAVGVLPGWVVDFEIGKQ